MDKKGSWQAHESPGPKSSYVMTRDADGSNVARQHGAMEHTIPPCDLDAVRRYRLARVREAVVQRDLAGIILYDPVNIRYAVDSSNMEVWCSRNEARYLYVPAEGPTCLFEFGGGSDLLTTGLPTIDEVRPTISFLYFIAGQRHRGEGEGLGRRFGFRHSRAERRQSARRPRPRHAARRPRVAASRLRDRRRLRGDGERPPHQVARRDRPDALFHRRVRAGHWADARGAQARHHRERALGPSFITATSPAAANGSSAGCWPPGRVPTRGSANARCGSSSAATSWPSTPTSSAPTAIAATSRAPGCAMRSPPTSSGASTPRPTRKFRRTRRC